MYLTKMLGCITTKYRNIRNRCRVKIRLYIQILFHKLGMNVFPDLFALSMKFIKWVLFNAHKQIAIEFASQLQVHYKSISSTSQFASQLNSKYFSCLEKLLEKFKAINMKGYDQRREYAFCACIWQLKSKENCIENILRINYKRIFKVTI